MGSGVRWVAAFAVVACGGTQRPSPPTTEPTTNASSAAAPNTANPASPASAPVSPALTKSTPRIKMGSLLVLGRLPPEDIQSIVRQNDYGPIRTCYEAGLRRNPSLEGRVATRFVIEHDGSVSNAADAGSDLPDAEAVSCVVNSFTTLRFPMPDGGIVKVVYPLLLDPG